jgi:maltose-binding protein MalE
VKALVALAVVAACSNAPRGVVLWHSYNGDERTALEANAAAWNEAHPEQELTLVAVPHDAFADKVSSAIPRGNGPDLFIYAQDRIGDWAGAGVIEPIEFWVDDARADRFDFDALAGMAYRDSLWGLPLCVKSLVLYYRTDLVAQPPRTTDDLLALAPAMTAKEGYALAYANIDLYGHAAWLHGFGGAVMDDAGTLAIATPEAAKAMQFARTLVTSRAVPEDAQAPLVSSLFNEGRAATVMSGPWFIAEIGPDVPWAVTTLPVVSATGKPAAPFASAEGIYMSRRAGDKDAAFAVMDFLTSDASATTRAKLSRVVVANPRAFDDPAVAADKVVTAFRAQLEHVVWMPKVPAMRSVWTPYRTALGETVSGRAEPTARLLEVERQVRSYVER